MTASVECAAFYFPNYHADPKNAVVHGPGWTEWELLRRAGPRFDGHRQPRRPLDGYADESSPTVMDAKIRMARAHGVDGFVFDWYYHEDGTFLAGALEQGYLGGRAWRDFRFALLWANHDWMDIHPAPADGAPRQLYPGALTPAAFARMTDYVVERYFLHPGYWRIDGKPWFTIYELGKFVAGMGGEAAAVAGLERFRQKARAAGLPGLHLTLIVSEGGVLPGESTIGDLPGTLARFPFDSTTSYIWVHHIPLTEFPLSEYARVARAVDRFERRLMQNCPLPFFPNITVGWDSSPRTPPDAPYHGGGYPYCPVMYGTPEEFGRAVAAAARRARANPPGRRLVTVNAWNEWTEGSYLEPDAEHGRSYLEALRDNVNGPSGPDDATSEPERREHVAPALYPS